MAPASLAFRFLSLSLVKVAFPNSLLGEKRCSCKDDSVLLSATSSDDVCKAAKRIGLGNGLNVEWVNYCFLIA